MDLDQLAALRTPEGSAALTAAAGLAGGDPLAAASALRAGGVPPALAAAALTQAELRHRAVGKFGPAAAGMFLTRAGLEQATRRVVADRRAERLRAAGVRTLADLGCGLGADALAAAR
ncbi:SAM-dependent methyltransferase, partial [Micromonospora sp. NPDC005194]